MSESCREMTNIEIANKIAKELMEADALGIGAWKIKIISALKDKDIKIFHLENLLRLTEDRCREYERRLYL